jgi:hypothetical protein
MGFESSSGGAMTWTSFPTLIAFGLGLLVLLQSVYFLRHLDASKLFQTNMHKYLQTNMHKYLQKNMHKHVQKTMHKKMHEYLQMNMRKYLQKSMHKYLQKKMHGNLQMYAWITIVLIVIAFLGIILYLSASYVFSPEFRIIMVRGQVQRVLFDVMVLGVSLLLAIIWIWARRDAKLPPRAGWLIFLAVIAWAGSVIRVIPLPESDYGNFTIYYYDLWWPVGVAWIVMTLTGCFMAVLKKRYLFSTFIVSGVVIDMVALSTGFFRLPFPDPLSQKAWGYALSLTSLSLVVVFFSWLFHKVSRGDKKEISKAIRSGSAIRSLLPKGPLSLKGKGREIIMLFGLLFILAGILNMFISFIPGSLTGVDLLLLGWIIISEAFTGSWISIFIKDYRAGNILKKWKELQTNLAERREKVKEENGRGDFWEKIKPVISMPLNSSTVIKILVLVFVIIIINASLDAGKTIIEPIRAVGFVDSANLTDTIAERIFNTLVELNQQLQPILITPTVSEKREKQVAYISPTTTASAMDTVLEKTSAIEIGGVSFSPSLIIEPLKGPLRHFFGVNVITGSLFKEGSAYTLLVMSNRGAIWKVTGSNVPDVREGPGALEAQAKSVTDITDQIAFKMINSQAHLKDLGITQSWSAFTSFRKGLEEIQQYEESQDLDQLSLAIEDFRKAIIADSHFGLAYYRLGLALQADRQPASAEEAFNSGLANLPEFVSLRNTLAYHLFYYDSYMPETAVASVPSTKVVNLVSTFKGEPRKQLSEAVSSLPEIKETDKTIENRTQRAVQLWRQVIEQTSSRVDRPDQASAFNGLCQAALMKLNQDESNFYRAYFYCRRAVVAYSELSVALHNTAEIRQAQAFTLSRMGWIVETYAYYKSPTPPAAQPYKNSWDCTGLHYNSATNQFYSNVKPNHTRYYTRSALHFYTQALALSPDDPAVQCYVAVDNQQMGRTHPMYALYNNPVAHLRLADNYMDQAIKDTFTTKGPQPSPYYSLALSEYQFVLDREPSNQRALNNFAYTYWVFRLHFSDNELKELNTSFQAWLDKMYAGEQNARENKKIDIDSTAEEYAREAVRLAKTDPVNFVIFSDTFAEVLFANRKPKEAIDVLQPLLNGNRVAKHPFYNEIRWDLAQVHLCQSYQEGLQNSSDQDYNHNDEAMELLQAIVHNEEGRDFKPYTLWSLPYLSLTSLPRLCIGE